MKKLVYTILIACRIILSGFLVKYMSYVIDHYSSLVFLHLSYYWILNHIINDICFFEDVIWPFFFSSYRNRYYYWNTITDQVCWLSPVHPRANITVSAQRIQGTDCKFYDYWSLLARFAGWWLNPVIVQYISILVSDYIYSWCYFSMICYRSLWWPGFDSEGG